MKKIFVAAAFVLTLTLNAAPAGINSKVKSTCYTKIEVLQVPLEILREASTKYSGFLLTLAYRSEEGTFKLVLAKDRKHIIAYYSSTAHFIKDEMKK
jgi:hypothetical protein